jgi:hypothetical protein
MTRLSNRQYPMLRMLYDNNSDSQYMTIDEAQAFDQRPFRSMLIQGWCAFRPGKGFHITKQGRLALDEFLNTDISRKNPMMPLTAYFDPTAYGLAVPAKKARVHVMAHKGAA